MSGRQLRIELDGAQRAAARLDDRFVDRHVLRDPSAHVRFSERGPGFGEVGVLVQSGLEVCDRFGCTVHIAARAVELAIEVELVRALIGAAAAAFPDPRHRSDELAGLLCLPPNNGKGQQDHARQRPCGPTKATGRRRSGRFSSNRPDEPITDARQRLDVARRFGVVVECDPEFPHGCIQAVVEIDHAFRPEHLHQLLARDDFARVLEQFGQHAQRLLRQSLRGSVAQQLAGAGAQHPPVKMNVLGVSHLHAIIRN